jgi:hypothetical protein
VPADGQELAVDDEDDKEREERGVKNGSNGGSKDRRRENEIEPPSRNFETPTGIYTTVMITPKLDPQTTLFFLCDVQTKFSEHFKILLSP